MTFLLGLFLGASLGAFFMAAIALGKRTDEDAEAWIKRQVELGQ